MGKIGTILGGCLIVVLLVVCCVGTSLMGTYNSLVQANTDVDAAWAAVETQYQRRFDLIPNLVNATQGFLNQEQKVFGDIAEARTKYAGAPSNSNEKVEATNQLDSALSRLLVIIENYPQLTSNETVKGLMDEIAGTENRIAVARNRYNDAVTPYNKRVRQFPTNIIAQVMGLGERDFYKSQQGAENAPTVNLNNSQEQTK